MFAIPDEIEGFAERFAKEPHAILARTMLFEIVNGQCYNHGSTPYFSPITRIIRLTNSALRTIPNSTPPHKSHALNPVAANRGELKKLEGPPTEDIARLIADMRQLPNWSKIAEHIEGIHAIALGAGRKPTS